MAWATSLLSGRLRLPDVLGFLILGAATGPFGLGLVHVSLTNPLISVSVALAASVLLYEGGRGIDLSMLRRCWLGLTLLVTCGVLITAALAALAAERLFHWDWQTAALLGAIIASTDPAAVIPVMRQAGIAERVGNVAQAESALNDATGAILTLIVLGAIEGRAVSPGHVAGSLVLMAGGGLLIGLLVAGVTAWVAHGRSPRLWALGAHNQQVVELITVLLSYGLASYLGTSGFMAAFAAGVVHGQTVTRAAHRTEPFFSTLSFLSRVAVFLILGAALDPARAVRPIAATLAFIALFMLVIRPAAVFSSILPDRNGVWTLPETLMLCWVRETGVIPAALAAYVASLAVANADAIVAKTSAVIFATVVVQGLTTRGFARLLRLTKRSPAGVGEA
ncbi:MAG: sodium:proton antiporter [bacterium]|nr:sodium:proton antiporter [bacterium]